MKNGYHAIYAKNYYDGIDAAQENGFDFVQFDLGVPRFFLDNMPDFELKNIRNYAESKNIEITFHAPGDNVDLFCDYPLIRKGINDQFRMIVEKANMLNAHHITFHAGIYPRFKKSGIKGDDFSSEYAEHYQNVFYENVKGLIDIGGDTFICIENFMLTEITQKAIRQLIRDTNRLFLTLDIAKMYSSLTEINQADFAFFTKHKDFIREMHVHDQNKEFGSHQIVGTGVVDFPLFMQFCNENVYLNHEVRSVESAKASMDKFATFFK